MSDYSLNMIIESKMSAEEFTGLAKKYRLNYSDVSTLLFARTGAVIKPQSLRTHVERHGAFSAPLTAALRLLFGQLENERQEIQA